MNDVYITDKTFDRVEALNKGEYDNCVFNGCNFANYDLSEFKFMDCTFNSCNLSMVKLNKTALRDVKFNECKLLGLRLDTCYGLGLSLSFDGCQLNHASFYNIKIKNTVFKNSNLQEADFTKADLTGALFDNCQLALATFDETILEKADLRSAHHYSINPESNRIKKAKFSILGVPGLLTKYDIEIEQ